MKTKDILNVLLLGLIVASIGYVFFIQSKQGIKVIGSDNVIDPFRYETGVYNDIYGGIDPNSTASHITENELQSLKFKKMSKVLIYTIPLMLIVFFLTKTKSGDIVKEEENINLGNISNDDEIRLSFLELAIKMTCLPDEVKSNYLREIMSDGFEYSDLIDTEKAWKDKKKEDAKIMGINPENTPAALMERWTREYRISNFKN